jgi:hypothetical protein
LLQQILAKNAARGIAGAQEEKLVRFDFHCWSIPRRRRRSLCESFSHEAGPDYCGQKKKGAERFSSNWLR